MALTISPDVLALGNTGGFQKPARPETTVKSEKDLMEEAR
jgi:hypothetical protein